MVDKFGWNRFRVVTISCIIGVFGSIIFTTRAGLLWLDIVDHFLNSYGLVVVGLFECLLVGWYYRIDKLHFHLSSARQGAYPKLWDIWWEWSVTFVAPMVLLIILVWSALDDLRRPYGGYPKEALLSIGMGVILVTFLASGFFSTLTRHKGREPGWDDEDLRD
jgi:neurotransmitter:Na+ symporter, NSS family